MSETSAGSAVSTTASTGSPGPTTALPRTPFPWGLLRPSAERARFRLPFLDGSVLLAGQDTGDAFALLEMRLAPDRGPDPHIHREEDEFFHVVEGAYRFRIGDTILDCGPGDVVKVERGVPHQLTAGPAGGRHLTMFTPAGPEGWFLEADSLARRGALDLAALGPLFERYGMTRVDPTSTRMT
ncbi:mannose-6-phosphate isomerase-like protein (cupin superfamily) [Actinoalloteichus hoggarensis]|nr:cupin domain-containing protein [Actinoalloteichus hoggarensis]MBB5919249.1 mannose-6-phosphate isomerase-like protein (cupin superfamily) [Actinoalloteichus hoggarensis]